MSVNLVRDKGLHLLSRSSHIGEHGSETSAQVSSYEEFILLISSQRPQFWTSPDIVILNVGILTHELKKDPSICPQHQMRSKSAYVRVGGGRWWPLLRCWAHLEGRANMIAHRLDAWSKEEGPEWLQCFVFWPPEILNVQSTNRDRKPPKIYQLRGKEVSRI